MTFSFNFDYRAVPQNHTKKTKKNKKKQPGLIFHPHFFCFRL